MRALSKRLGAMALFAALAAQAVHAQEVNPEELIRQIHRNMRQIEDDLARTEAEAAKQASTQTQEDLQKLIDQMQGRSRQIGKDMDDLLEAIKNMKSSSSSSSSGSGQPSSKPGGQAKNQGKPGSRNRNESENPEGSRQGEQQGQEKPGKPKGSAGEDNSQKPQPGEGENRPSGERVEPDPEKVLHQHLHERWGMLPPEMRQRLIDRNFQDFTPEYELEIRAYFKRILNP